MAVAARAFVWRAVFGLERQAGLDWDGSLGGGAQSHLFTGGSTLQVFEAKKRAASRSVIYIRPEPCACMLACMLACISWAGLGWVAGGWPARMLCPRVESTGGVDVDGGTPEPEPEPEPKQSVPLSPLFLRPTRPHRPRQQCLAKWALACSATLTTKPRRAERESSARACAYMHMASGLAGPATGGARSKKRECQAPQAPKPRGSRAVGGCCLQRPNTKQAVPILRWPISLA